MKQINIHLLIFFLNCWKRSKNCVNRYVELLVYAFVIDTNLCL